MFLVARCRDWCGTRVCGDHPRQIRQTTVSNKAAPCRLDHVNRQLEAPRPNVLWLSDITYVATWTAFVQRRLCDRRLCPQVAGWRVSRTAHAGFVLDALEQALDHLAASCTSDRGCQYVSIKCTERLP